MQCNLHHPQERLWRVHQREVHEPRAAPARMGLETLGRDPRRHSLWGLLLEETVAGDALAVALHRERAVAQVRDQRRGYAFVVREQIAFRDAVVREEDTVGTR